MKRDFLTSLFLHIIFLLPLAIGGAKRKGIEYPAVLTVNLIPTIERPMPIEKEEGVELVKQVKKVEPKIEKREEKKPEKKEEKRYFHKGMGITTEGGRYPSYYLEAIVAKIGENWFNPYQGQNISLKTTIYFLVKRDGEIVEARIEKGSGREDYDQYCLRAVLLTKRLPPIPEDMRVEELKVHLEFEHK